MALPEALVQPSGCQRNFEWLSELILAGNGDPEGAVTAKIGAVYHRLDGGTSTSFYVKEADSGDSTGWVAK